MDMILDKIIAIGGPLGVLVVVVFIFVKAFRDTSASQQVWLESLMKNNQAWVERMHLDHIAAREQTRVCLDKNTAAMIENSAASRELTMSVRQLTKTQ